MTRKELADAMLKGVDTPGVQESRGDYVWGYMIPQDGKLCAACALGCALIGMYGGDYLKAEDALNKYPAGPIASMAGLLGISEKLAGEIEDRHIRREPVERIVAWLKGES